MGINRVQKKQKRQREEQFDKKDRYPCQEGDFGLEREEKHLQKVGNQKGKSSHQKRTEEAGRNKAVGKQTGSDGAERKGKQIKAGNSADKKHITEKAEAESKDGAASARGIDGSQSYQQGQ